MAWKFEFYNNLGEKDFKYWQNDISDDFLRYIPEIFLVDPENFQDPIGSGNWTIYAFDKTLDKLYDSYVWKKGHRLILDIEGVLKFERFQKPIFTPGEQVIKAEYLLKKREVENLFEINILEPEWQTDNDQKFAVITEDDILANDKIVIDAEFQGLQLKKNPYDKMIWGKNELLEFKENYSDEDRGLIKSNLMSNKNGLRIINKYVLNM